MIKTLILIITIILAAYINPMLIEKRPIELTNASVEVESTLNSAIDKESISAWKTDEFLFPAPIERNIAKGELITHFNHFNRMD